MYFINQEQIDERIQFLKVLADACGQLSDRRIEGEDSLLRHLSQERILHLAIETVTDVGSLLIDAFILRDASSYEDIVDIVRGEGAYSDSLAETLLELVRLRKPLVQDYTAWKREGEGLHPLIGKLPAALEEFATSVKAFIQKELA